MKTKILFILSFVQSVFISLNAQIGVNTETPVGIFHIDAKGNNPTGTISNSSLTLDDIVVSNQGNLGIGTVAPRAKLHIVTGGTASTPVIGVKLVDGNQKADRLLTSDTNGYASWKDVPPMPVAVATKVGSNIPTNTATFYNTNTYIILPPGRWKVTATTLIAVSTGLMAKNIQDKVWGHSFFSESNAATQTAANMSSDVENSKQMAALLTKYTYNVMIGTNIINNKTNASKRYYYIVGSFTAVGDVVDNTNFAAVAGTANYENSIVAVLIQD
ncbi:hypothetical protein CLV62_1435 [Dysgonomonas alginatilytica]|uniref:Uncharacterized protein n=1 Tax=Dysgonomonas alginatilytica TaxID=1605892 RepID=A0A2V3PHS9_9BACT|nr:hypothetical protein [Dysgonomonas alginatilytica]PXV58825.1 hypothetical protein CLV62_1435 [Dysgonomonas alginatilytica]